MLKIHFTVMKKIFQRNNNLKVISSIFLNLSKSFKKTQTIFLILVDIAEIIQIIKYCFSKVLKTYSNILCILQDSSE